MTSFIVLFICRSLKLLLILLLCFVKVSQVSDNDFALRIRLLVCLTKKSISFHLFAH